MEREMDGDKVKVTFLVEVKSITAGQSAVFYDGKSIVGGGWLC